KKKKKKKRTYLQNRSVNVSVRGQEATSYKKRLRSQLLDLCCCCCYCLQTKHELILLSLLYILIERKIFNKYNKNGEIKLNICRKKDADLSSGVQDSQIILLKYL
ncbi:GSCOCG00006398001-RA-CDS, partial [Cotesia congregata]